MALTVLIAWGVEIACGWPAYLYRRIRHPVVWIGWLTTRLERLFNREHRGVGWRRIAGALTALSVVLLSWSVASLIVGRLPTGPAAILVQALIASSLLASRSLYEHVFAVYSELAVDIASAREAVSHIVGRDPARLDETGIARAALESLAENTSDAVIAPLFWGVLLGLPGMAAYKAVNTLDSMIGHRNSRYEQFGKFAARLDDAANWLPARLSAMLFVFASRRPAAAWATMMRDARQHRSVNAGWPEAAFAGALQVRLSGPRQYGEMVLAEPWLNGGARDADRETLMEGLYLYRRAMGLAAVLLAVIVLLEFLR